MKKILLYVFILLIAVACNEKEDNTNADQYSFVQLSEISLEASILIEKASDYEVMQLSEFDFEVVYSDVTISKETTHESIQNALGYPEDYYYNNKGNISTANGYRRWELSYPDYSDPVVRVIFLSKQEVDENGNEYYGDTYIVGVSMLNIETYRGLKVGDTVESVLELYGQPAIIQEYRANQDYIELVYTDSDKKLEVVLDRTCSEVWYMFLDYRME